VDKLAEMGRRAGVQFVVAAGGGTVVDTAKAVAALIPARGSAGQSVCPKWLELGAADAESSTLAASSSPEPLPLVCVPSTVGGALAAASPRMALHALDEQLLAAPRWRPPCAPPAAAFGSAGATEAALPAAPWPYPRAAVFADHTYLPPGLVPAAEGLQLLAAQGVDLLLARAHNARRAAARTANRSEDKDEDEDEDEDEDGNLSANPAHDFDEGVATQRLAEVVLGLRRAFAALGAALEAAAGPRSATAAASRSGSPPPETECSRQGAADLRGVLLPLALELGALAGSPRLGRAPGAALARSLQPQHLAHEPWQRVLPALTRRALAAAAAPAPGAAPGASCLTLIDAPLAAALLYAASDRGSRSDAAAWDAEVRRWLLADAPALRSRPTRSSQAPPRSRPQR
jgi:hypothetical protein